jgi:hypothetical protein
LPDSRAAQDLHPYFQPIVAEVLRRAPSRGIYPFLTSTRRPYALQACYYAQGRLQPGQSATYQGFTVAVARHGESVIAQCRGEQVRVPLSEWTRTVTNARPSESWHTLGLAADFAFRSSATARDARYDLTLYRKLAEIFTEVCPDVRWGGGWSKPDMPHFEWHPGITIGEAAAGILPSHPKECHACGRFRDAFEGEACTGCTRGLRE